VFVEAAAAAAGARQSAAELEHTLVLRNGCRQRTEVLQISCQYQEIR
jgi:hypothetical protein